MTAFQDALRQSPPSELESLTVEMLMAIAGHGVADRFGRVETRADKRRPKPQKFLTEPRDQARKRLISKR